MTRITTLKIINPESRAMALDVIDKVYLQEKNWIQSAQQEIPEDIATNKSFSWFLAKINNRPVGVLRIFYDPPLEFPPDFKITLNNNIDLEKIAKTCRFVEIGRFMILPRYRHNMLIALRLMRIALKEVVERDYTHFITDVTEGELHSPFRFHTKILGFEVVGTHLHGELNYSCTRMILTLDILKAYQRLKARKNRLYWNLTEGIRGVLEQKLVTR
ncbi:GNAT family N-acetyltransferase [candidate division KSB1 bacterium]|nr:GNAT family N-acetyltransferase [candidate division KSB1 bacterium]